MYYYAVRTNDVVTGIIEYENSIISSRASSRLEKITKPEFETYREFGFAVIDIDELVEMLNLTLTADALISSAGPGTMIEGTPRYRLSRIIP